MEIDRQRPKPDEDLALWLTGVVNDAMRDAVEAGLDPEMAVSLVLILGSSWARGRACMSETLIASATKRRP